MEIGEKGIFIANDLDGHLRTRRTPLIGGFPWSTTFALLRNEYFPGDKLTPPDINKDLGSLNETWGLKAIFQSWKATHLETLLCTTNKEAIWGLDKFLWLAARADIPITLGVVSGRQKPEHKVTQAMLDLTYPDYFDQENVLLNQGKRSHIWKAQQFRKLVADGYFVVGLDDDPFASWHEALVDTNQILAITVRNILSLERPFEKALQRSELQRPDNLLFTSSVVEAANIFGIRILGVVA